MARYEPWPKTQYRHSPTLKTSLSRDTMSIPHLLSKAGGNKQGRHRHGHQQCCFEDAVWEITDTQIVISQHLPSAEGRGNPFISIPQIAIETYGRSHQRTKPTNGRTAGGCTVFHPDELPTQKRAIHRHNNFLHRQKKLPAPTKSPMHQEFNTIHRQKHSQNHRQPNTLVTDKKAP